MLFRWQTRIKPKLKEIDKIFNGYDPEVIKTTSYEYYLSEIRNIRCGNRSIAKQMKSLKYNIEILQNIQKQYGSIDNFLTSDSPIKIISMLSSSRFPETKLKQIGEALAWEYIRNVGIDGAKPDVHLRRFLGSARMGESCKNEASIDEVYNQVENLSLEAGISKAAIDIIIWTFCANSKETFGEICTANPKCELCPVKDKCNFRR